MVTTPRDALLAAFSSPERRDRPTIVVGAGVSLTVSPNHAKSWAGLLIDALEYAEPSPEQAAALRGRIDALDRAARQADAAAVRVNRQSFDLTDGAASEDSPAEGLLQLATELKALLADRFNLWLSKAFDHWEVQNRRILDALKLLDSTLATTNYDDLLLDPLNLKHVLWTTPPRVLQVLNGRVTTEVIYLHGRHTDPESVVFGRPDYKALLVDKRAQFLEQLMAAQGQVVFIGCGAGLTDPNFSALLRWVATFDFRHEHFRLGRDADVASWARLPNVRDIAYGPSYDDLPIYLSVLAKDAIKAREAAKARRRPARPIGPDEPWRVVDRGRPVNSVALSSDGRYLASTEGNRVHLWSVPEPDSMVEVTEAEGWTGGKYLEAATVARLTSDGGELVAGGDRGLARWSVPGGDPIETLTRYNVEDIAFGGPQTVLICDLDGVSVRDAPDRELVSLTKSPGGGIAMAASSDSRFAATAGTRIGGSPLTLWALPGVVPESDWMGRPMSKQLGTRKGSWTSVAWSADRLVAAEGGRVIVLDVEALLMTETKSLRSLTLLAELRGDLPQQVATWSELPHMTVTNAEAGTTTAVQRIALSAAGRTLALAGVDWWAVWDISTFMEPREIRRRPLDQVGGLAISGDGRLIATASGKRVQLWRLE